MKYNINIICALTLLSILPSCQDLMDLKPLDKMTEADVWNDPTLTEAFVVGQYKSLYNTFTDQFMFSSCTDDSYTLSGYMNDYNDGTLSPDSYGYKNHWFSDYGGIRLCNVFFEKIDQATVAETQKRQLIGEMKFIRAYLYADLLKQFGGVPLITKAFRPGDDFLVTRNSYDDCVAFVVKELDEAAFILKDFQMTGPKVGRATQGAALALKSRVLLYAASKLNNSSMDIGKWQKAADAAKAVIDLGKYSLVSNYSDIWNVKRNSEIIMDRAFLAKNFERQFDLENGANGFLGWGGNYPGQKLVDAYETTNGLLPVDDPSYDPQNPYINRDPRFYATILYNSAPWKGRVIEPWVPGGLDSKDGVQPWCATATGYYLKKYMQESVSAIYNAANGDQHAIFFRLGEIYLNYAEAVYHLRQEGVAREYVNLIRQRPGVLMPQITESGEALYKRIQHERRIELAFEDHRYFDVRRWEIAMQVENEPAKGIDIVKNSDGSFTYNYVDVVRVRIFLPQHYWHPIPRIEIERNPKLEQNPGYN